jgi:rhamnosyltransferase
MNVGVILCSYNGEKYIKEQIDSLINQKDINVDIHIYDDSSTDNTYNILKEYYRYYSNIYIYRNINNTGSHAINFLNSIKNFKKKYHYYALSDQDDIWVPIKIIHAINIMQKNQAYCYSSSVDIYTDKFIKKIDKSGIKEFDYFFESAGPGCTYVFSNAYFCVLREWLSKINYVDVKHHDWFIYTHARSNNYKWYIDSKSYIKYRFHNQNLEGPNIGWHAAIKRLIRLFNGDFIDEAIKYSNKNFYNISFINVIKNPTKYRRNTFHATILMFVIVFYVLKNYKKLILWPK